MERITIELKSKGKRDMLLKILDAVGIPYVAQQNPSSRGDKWFLESGNIQLIEKGIADIKAGRVTEIKDVDHLWESIL